jgi:hypothetical protein
MIIRARIITLVLSCVIGLGVLCGCDVPAPKQHDHAMLRGYFGKSPKEIEKSFGKPKSISHADSALPPQNGTKQQREQFRESTERMRYTFHTPDGKLVFHFNLNDRVYRITYAGDEVSPEP